MQKAKVHNYKKEKSYIVRKISKSKQSWLRGNRFARANISTNFGRTWTCVLLFICMLIGFWFLRNGPTSLVIEKNSWSAVCTSASFLALSALSKPVELNDRKKSLTTYSLNGGCLTFKYVFARNVQVAQTMYKRRCSVTDQAEVTKPLGKVARLL